MRTPFGTLNLESEVAREIQNFFERNLIDEGLNYEVEAKFGLLLDKGTGRRTALPICTSTILQPGDWYHFDSDMSLEQHRRLNQLFNGEVAAASPSINGGARWRYRHERTVDSFVNSGDRRRMRVTKDATTGKIMAVIEKKRIADLEIYLPALSCDLRLSINTESRIEGVVETQLVAQQGSERYKDRLSYSFDDFIQIDLTQVRQNLRGGNQMKHELEVEVIDIKRHLTRGDPEAFVHRFYASLLDIASKFG